MTPNKTNIRKLVVALRSGGYHQAQSVLCKVEDGQAFHCCLGVGCRVAMKNGVKMKINNEFKSDIQFNGNSGFGPKELHSWLGLSSRQARKLADMNDEGKSFKEIANYLEKRYL